MAEPIQHHARVSYPGMTAAAAELGRHRRVEWFHALLVGVVLVEAISWGHELAFWLVQKLSSDWMFIVGPDLPTVVPALLALAGLMLAGWAYRAYERRTIRRRFDANAIPLEFDALYELGPDELRMSSDRVAITHKWATVDAVEKSTEGWVISANCLTCLVPHDSFADEAAEREFVTNLLGHMTETARARSADALAFTTFS